MDGREAKPRRSSKGCWALSTGARCAVCAAIVVATGSCSSTLRLHAAERGAELRTRADAGRPRPHRAARADRRRLRAARTGVRADLRDGAGDRRARASRRGPRVGSLVIVHARPLQSSGRSKGPHLEEFLAHRYLHRTPRATSRAPADGALTWRGELRGAGARGAGPSTAARGLRETIARMMSDATREMASDLACACSA